MQDTVDPAAAPLRTLAQSFENARREVKAFMPSPLPFSRSPALRLAAGTDSVRQMRGTASTIRTADSV